MGFNSAFKDLMTRKWEPCGSEANNVSVADVRVRNKTLFPLKQISYTFICFNNSDNQMVVRIFRLNFTFLSKPQELEEIFPLYSDVIGYVCECCRSPV